MNNKKDIRFVKGIGDAKAKQLLRLGISDVEGLITYYPVRFEDRTEVSSIHSLSDGQTACVTARVVTGVTETFVRKGLTYYQFDVCDDSGIMTCVFFNNKYIKNTFRKGNEYTFYGKVSYRGRSVRMMPREFEAASANSCSKAIIPVYALTSGITQKALRNAVRNVLDSSLFYADECIPPEITKKYGLCSRSFALQNIHFPADKKSLEIARRRLIFEEFFLFQISLRRIRENLKRHTNARFSYTDVSPLLSKLKFTLTDAQNSVLNDIMNDLSGEYCMNRLVQGDVGSGKTIVAAAALFLAAKNGFQSAMMAPTEVLATQHFNDLSPLLAQCNIKCDLLCGSTSAKEKRRIYSELESGEIQIIFGTHALISEKVAFKNLSLVITDEQHRFGVRQRALLSEKGSFPHTLVMTATPIPRTLALIMYGDMDISVINALPPGRQKIDTLCIDDTKRERMYTFLRKQIDEGNRVYIVCPAVDESDEIPLRSAEAHFKELNEKVFPDIPMGLVHGKMGTKAKHTAMSDFATGNTKILVATTVIEVGVNVPEATVIVVENAERFGLSQLHQLRGRVGRGTSKSYCILVIGSSSDDILERMQIMTKNSNGFNISEKDLSLRGPGDFFGTRQHGMPALKIANLATDMEILKQSGEAAAAVLNSDKALNTAENLKLRKATENLIKSLCL